MQAKWFLLSSMMTGFLSTPASAQILTENAGVTSPETPTVREFVTLFDSENLFDLRLNHQLLIGLDPKTELRVTLPTVLHRRASFRGTEGFGPRFEVSEDMAGLGDLSIRLKRSLWQIDDVMESTRWALLGELVTPTGDDDEKASGVRIPRRLQLGTGAWGYGVGSAFTVIRDRQRFSTDVYYRHRSRHEGVRLSPSLHWDLAYWYRLAPAKFDPEQDTTEIRGVIELLNTYRFASRGSGLDGNGFEFWVAPGLQIYPRRDLLIELSAQLPIFENLHDELGDRRWGLLLAVKLLF